MTRKDKILVVDDERATIDHLVAILNGDHALCVAKNGERALALVQSEPRPDLILLDIVMPEMDGYEVCRRLKADPQTCDIPVIFLTVKSSVEDEAYGLELGAVDYIAKPISPPIVKARIKIHLTAINESKMRLQKERAEAANQAKNAFLAMVSHEIRTPMNAIMGMNELLTLTQLTDKQQEYVATQKRAGEDLLILLDDVLDVCDMERGAFTLTLAPFYLADVVAVVQAVVGAQASAKGIGFNITCQSGLAEQLVGDRHRITQVLLNLCGNGVKFTHEGSVSMLLETHPKGVCFVVRDTGIGIGAGDQARIFDAFSQSDVSLTRRYGGLGLGLHITRQLVELMHGTLRLQSQQGQGTTFTVVIPFEQVSQPQQQPVVKAEPDPATMQALPRLSILVAEDAEDNALLLKHYFKESGHELTFARDGQEALTCYRQGAFDLILMDVQMPVMDGYAATRQIRCWEQEEGRATLPIVALTAHAMADAVAEAKAAGCTQFLSKPIQKRRLMEEINNIIQARSQGC
ncbi:response regulator receiver sensor hybrid histidine kinase [Magnetococcus marinus MC-1]|uniref:histidine kinase n=1 Tax=Magnetococcus marinus (strain ATCC BAA-1437 / JCM 17883 / MC-1) TaxID=156889 RepID=A0LAA0_MAGMM|nr:response regulator [Magnetococcus marinus]ABK44893.1 response regulator receiver sensor hybrid histidine kinase [Magnetococcus marinus MC-1]